MAIDVETLPSLTHAEAMALVDAGRTVSRKSEWVMREAGYAWGCWIDRQRRWTNEDHERAVERDHNWTPEEDPPPIESSGPYYRAFHTLCESIELGEPHQGELDATDYFDATEAMTEMWNLYGEYMSGSQPLKEAMGQCWCREDSAECTTPHCVAGRARKAELQGLDAGG